VHVTSKNGVTYEGIFHASSVADNDLGVALKMAYKIEVDGKRTFCENLVILGKDVLGISAFNLNIVAESKAEQEKFMTDYNEEIYTTVIDKSDPKYKERELLAAKLAKEIESASTSNLHIAEERNLAIQGKELDEEDLYGAVLRDPATAKTTRQKSVTNVISPTSEKPQPTGKYVAKIPEFQKSKSVRDATAVTSIINQETVKSKDTIQKDSHKQKKAPRVGEGECFHPYICVDRRHSLLKILTYSRRLHV
jgi:hypothetical protein